VRDFLGAMKMPLEHPFWGTVEMPFWEAVEIPFWKSRDFFFEQRVLFSS
jgi:hypothetical protein